MHSGENKCLCPLGGDESLDCAKCVYSPDFHFVNGDCVLRHQDNNFKPMSKKGNMAYWDAIDELSTEFASKLIECSTRPVKCGDEFVLDDDDIMIDISKQITEFATNLLMSEYGAEFPYVDENY